MSILLSKLASQLLYPVGLFAVLFLIAMIQTLRGRLRFALVIMMLASTLLLLSATPKVAGRIAASLESQYPSRSIETLPEAEVAIVLGGLLDAPVKPRLEIELTDTTDRLHHAYRLWKAGKTKLIYVTGGNVYDGYRAETESVYAKRLLIEWGVNPAAIAIGEQAKTTEQNAVEAADFLKHRGVLSAKVFLITSGLHMPRSVSLFRFAGLKIDSNSGIKQIPVSTDTLVTPAARPPVFAWIPSASALSLTTRAWHEKMGLWVFQLRRWFAG